MAKYTEKWNKKKKSGNINTSSIFSSKSTSDNPGIKRYKCPKNLKTFSASHAVRNLKESDKEIEFFIYQIGKAIFENICQ